MMQRNKAVLSMASKAMSFFLGRRFGNYILFRSLTDVACECELSFPQRTSASLPRDRPWGFMRVPNITMLAVAWVTVSSSLSLAEPVAVVCTILPGDESASVTLTNPFAYNASCMANCKFSTAVYDDNPQIICAKPVIAGKEVEMCILKAANNKLLKVVEGLGDCRKP
jgi:hypothetical protein